MLLRLSVVACSAAFESSSALLSEPSAATGAAMLPATTAIAAVKDNEPRILDLPTIISVNVRTKFHTTMNL